MSRQKAAGVGSAAGSAPAKERKVPGATAFTGRSRAAVGGRLGFAGASDRPDGRFGGTEWDEIRPRIRERRKGSRPISRVLSRATIHLGRASPRASSDLPGNSCGPQVRAVKPACFPIWSCSRWGLPCRRMLPPARCALTAPFHPYRHHIAAVLRRFALCCTFRGLSPPRRYLAPCPMEPGLSSAAGAAVAWPTPARIIRPRVATPLGYGRMLPSCAAHARTFPCAFAR
jgi:hypothetical protein